MKAEELKGPVTERSGFWESRLWLLVLAGLLICQGWMTLGLFGTERPWLALGDDQPIVSGRHALHLYHGFVGAQTFKRRAQTIAYDSNFDAGYLKTPFFDSGSKPAELCLWLIGGRYSPATYKIGLACSWCLLPLLLVAAGWFSGQSHGESCLTAFLGMVVCWSDLGRELLAAGDWAFFLGIAFATLWLGWLQRYHVSPGIWSWLGITVTSWALGFFYIPTLLILLPAILVYYLTAGTRHRLAWHMGLLSAFLIAFAGNWLWLQDIIDYWWIQTESSSSSTFLTTQSLLSLIWEHPAWKNSLNQGLYLSFIGFGFLGVIVLQKGQKKEAARCLGATILTCLVLALLGDTWEPLQRLEPAKYLFPAVLLATGPAIQGIRVGYDALARVTGSRLRGAAIFSSLLLGAGIALHVPLGEIASRCVRREPLPLGLSPTVQTTLQALQQQTTPAARILWEETPDTDDWTPLLPVLTQRVFIGGLGDDANIEHNAVRLRESRRAGIAGRALDEWSDSQLAEYCRLYNVGWIVCRSSRCVSRFQAMPEASDAGTLPDGGRLFVVRRKPDYFLAGTGRVIQCDNKVLTLADVQPQDGQVVLSFHYHSRIRPSIDRVRVEKELRLQDSVGFIRLRVPAPVSRLTLYWDDEP